MDGSSVRTGYFYTLNITLNGGLPMNENKWPGDNAVEELSEEEKQKIRWNISFSQMRFWIFCNLLETLVLFTAPFLSSSFDKLLHPRWPQYPYHYEISQIFLFLVILAISLTGAFFLFTAKEKSRLAIVKWLSLLGAVMMCLTFVIFQNGIGHATTHEERLYWVLFLCSLLHVLSCFRTFHAYKNL